MTPEAAGVALAVGFGSREDALFTLSLALLVVGTVAAAVALRQPRLDVVAAALAGAGVAAWLLSNTEEEGRTLLVVVPGNGVTEADLVAVPAVLLLGVLCWRRLRGQA